MTSNGIASSVGSPPRRSTGTPGPAPAPTSSAPAVLNVHTPTASFAVLHSLTQDSLESLRTALTRKTRAEYHGAPLGPGWLKYEFGDTVWDLDDDADYTIFVWRQQGAPAPPTLHLHDPAAPLPAPPAYRNPAYFAFRAPPRKASPPRSTRTRGTKRSARTAASAPAHVDADAAVPAFRRDFEKFHAENGVRTVMGSIGPVQNVRMLLKSGYRHVYISRKFALEHAFIPADAAPGHYGYGGLVNIGTWPITLTPVVSPPSDSDPIPAPAPAHAGKKSKGKKNAGPPPTLMPVYLSEEPHFDVVLGRSFFERRQIQTSSTDPTDVVCLDTGEHIACELVILKDGRGEIVTVT